MKKTVKTRIGEEFRPAPQLKKLYYIYSIIAFFFLVLPWFIPVLFFAPFNVIIIITLVVFIPILAIFIFALCWIPKYYKTMIYKLTQNEMVWRRGVWFKNTGIVPYNRITNIDIAQGPISRSLGIGSLKIQTAGYSSSKVSAEIRMEGIEDFEGLRELIMGFVRGRKPVAVESYEDVDSKVLSELIKIRKLLSKK